MSVAALANEEEADESELEGLQSAGHLEGLVGGEWLLVMLAIVCLILTFPVSFWLCLQVVNEYEEPVLLRLGHVRRTVSKGPGIYFILPCTDQLIRVDMRIKTYDMPFQEAAGCVSSSTDGLFKVFTKDPLLVEVDGVVYYRIHDALLAVTKVTNPDSAVQLLTQAVIRNTLAAKTIYQIITEREHIAKEVQAQLENVTVDWGITVQHVEIKNVKTKVNFGCLKSDNTNSGQPHTTIVFTYP